ncbi:iron-sulfur cluster assembly 1 homolog, mitochondrial isoform X2 [Pleurodeles waltl]|uniref:iron-sulfur cluster assembly 1 homolog, mitochondrial isoform X2 n=1 Tax=Pleurodeles waltl TaxID=8319 RepID=UPI003709B2B5
MLRPCWPGAIGFHHALRFRSGHTAADGGEDNMAASVVRATVKAVSRRKLQPSRAALTLTPSAVSKIRQLLKEKPDHIGLKIGVRTRGCNGLSYSLEYTKAKGESDEVVVQDDIYKINRGKQTKWNDEGSRKVENPSQRKKAGSCKSEIQGEGVSVKD